MAPENRKGIERKEESRECPEHGSVHFWYETDTHYKCGVPAEMVFGLIDGVCGRKLGKT